MVESINVALAPLKNALAANDKVPLIPEAALEQQFHGLSLHQLVQLTDAPALAVVSKGRAPDGSQRERFAVDGNDEQKCGVIARQILLDAATPFRPGDIREVRLSGGDGPEQTLVRDHNDVVYRILDGQAAIDQQLTDLLRQQRSSPSDPRPAHTSPATDQGQTLVEVLEEILEMSAALRARNATTQQAIEDLVAASGQSDLDTAIAAADPEALAITFKQALAASTQVEQLSYGIADRVDAVLRLARSGNRDGAQPHAVGDVPNIERAPGRPDQAEPISLSHEPF